MKIAFFLPYKILKYQTKEYFFTILNNASSFRPAAVFQVIKKLKAN